jgi:hypothetical protein
MSIIELDFLQAHSVKDVEELKHLLHDTYYITGDYGGHEDATAYVKQVKSPNHFFRIASWPTFDDFITGFQDCLTDGALDEWSVHMNNSRATGYNVEYSTLPLDAPIISFIIYHLSSDDTKELEDYTAKLKTQIGGSVAGSLAAGWNCEDTAEFMFVCGWKSAEDYEAAFRNDQESNVKEKVKNLDRIEEYLVQKVDLGEPTS